MVFQWMPMIPIAKRDSPRFCVISLIFNFDNFHTTEIMIFIFCVHKLQRISKLEEEEKNQAETRKRRFFTEILNAAREYQVQSAATYKRRKQRNDGVQVWFDLFPYFKISKQDGQCI